MSERPPENPWISLAKAAQHLDESTPSLRKKLERAAVIAPDGVVEAELSGVRARKLGKMWKLRLSRRWV